MQKETQACELCGDTRGLSARAVVVAADGNREEEVVLCEQCRQQMDEHEAMDFNHWRCLNDSMWSQKAAVQILAWRMLTRLSRHPDNPGWPQELLDMLYLDEALLELAQQGMEETPEEDNIRHVDCHGQALSDGDTVILSKDLNVKGAGFTAKRGTAVRNISLVSDNAEQIEGKINGQQIVILTRYVKKAGA